MKMPDGFIFRVIVHKRKTEIEITKEKLICCRSCKRSITLAKNGCLFCEMLGRPVDPCDYCSFSVEEDDYDEKEIDGRL